MTIPPVLIVSSPSQIPGHSMYGDWALPGRPYCYLAMEELCFGNDDFQGPRFAQADPRHPGILVRNMPNPCQLPYRMIDGRRRLEKLRRQAAVSGYFVVFEYDEVRPFIRDFHRSNSMTLDKHDLIHEFPEHREKIHALKTGNAHFAKLFTAYHEADHEIHSIESGAVNTSDDHLENRKKERLHLKDQLYRMLVEK